MTELASNPEIESLKAQIGLLEARPPTVINVTTPDVNVTTPPVNIYPNFAMPEQPVINVNLPEAKATTKTVIRDGAGRIDKVIEE